MNNMSRIPPFLIGKVEHQHPVTVESRRSPPPPLEPEQEQLPEQIIAQKMDPQDERVPDLPGTITENDYFDRAETHDDKGTDALKRGNERGISPTGGPGTLTSLLTPTATDPSTRGTGGAGFRFLKSSEPKSVSGRGPSTFAEENKEERRVGGEDAANCYSPRPQSCTTGSSPVFDVINNKQHDQRSSTASSQVFVHSGKSDNLQQVISVVPQNEKWWTSNKSNTHDNIIRGTASADKQEDEDEVNKRGNNNIRERDLINNDGAPGMENRSGGGYNTISTKKAAGSSTSSRLTVRSRPRLTMRPLFTAFPSDVYQSEPGLTFEAVGSDGCRVRSSWNLLAPSTKRRLHHAAGTSVSATRVESNATKMDRFSAQLYSKWVYVNLIFLLAVPYTATLILSAAFVFPGYSCEKCRFLGKDHCRLEYVLSSLSYLLSAHLEPCVACGDPNKFMDWRTHVFAKLRTNVPLMLISLAVEVSTNYDRSLMLFYLVVLKLCGGALMFPVFELCRFFLGYEDWWNVAKCFSDPWGSFSRLFGLTVSFTAMMSAGTLFPVSCIFGIGWGAVLIEEHGFGMSIVRAFLFLIIKRTCYRIFCWGMNRMTEPVQSAGFLRQYGIMWIHMQIALFTAIIGVHSPSWTDVVLLCIADMFAFAMRIFTYSGDEWTWVQQRPALVSMRNFLRRGKPKPVGEMKLDDLRGWDLILEGFIVQIAYTAILLFYPFAYFLLGADHVMYRWWFPYPHSVSALLLLFVIDLLQDEYAKAEAYRRTNCTYSYFFGQPLFSMTTVRFLVNMGSMCWVLWLFSNLAYTFDEMKLAIFRADVSK